MVKIKAPEIGNIFFYNRLPSVSTPSKVELEMIIKERIKRVKSMECVLLSVGLASISRRIAEVIILLSFPCIA